MSHKELIDYFSEFEEDTPIRSKSFQVGPENIPERYSIPEIRRETIFEKKLRDKIKDFKLNKPFIEKADLMKYRDTLKEIGILPDENAKKLGIRNLPKINNETFEEFKNSLSRKIKLYNLYETLISVKFNFNWKECYNWLW